MEKELTRQCCNHARLQAVSLFHFRFREGSVLALQGIGREGNNRTAARSKAVR